MKILTFNYEYPPVGGGGGIIHSLVAEDLARRHRVVVVTSAFQDLPRHEVRNGVEIHRVPVVGRRARDVASLRSLLTYPPPAWARAYAILRRERFDLIHSHFAVPTGPGSLPAARLAGLPHIISIYGGDIYDPSKRLSPHRLPGVRQAVGWVLRHSTAVVACSSDTRSKARGYYRYDGRIDVIPLGIRIPRIESVSRAELGLPDAPMMATVGRLVKRKAIDRLISAVARPECDGIHLVVVGDGPERRSLESLAARLKVSNRIRFVGRVSESRKWRILASADAYVSATLHEGFGLVYLEAMAAGLPVVSTDHGGQVDFLRDGVTGHLLKAGDTEGLSAAMARVAADPRAAARMGAANRQRVQEHRIERCAARYEELFERILSGRKAERPLAASGR